jgi:hypothetical protein
VIDAMTLFEVEELTGYWTDHPPLHLLIAAYLGKQSGKQTASPKSPTARARNAYRAAEQLLTELGPVLVSGDVHAGLGPVLLDAAELRRRTEAATQRPRTEA